MPLQRHIDKAKDILNHPLCKHGKWSALCRIARMQMLTATKQSAVLPFAERSRFLMSPQAIGMVDNYYYGVAEYADMMFLLHCIRAGERLLDVGGNHGSFSILAAKERGASTVIIEPTAATFKQLTDNLILNGIEEQVEAIKAAAGSEPGEIEMAVSSVDVYNKVHTGGDLPPGMSKETVPLITLDSLLDKGPFHIVKIDVEGFEHEVLAGAKQLLQTSELQAVYLETLELGKQYGGGEASLAHIMAGYGFKPFTYDPATRQLVELSAFDSKNAIFIRDREAIQQKLLDSKPVRINGKDW